MEFKSVFQTDVHGFFLYAATAYELYLSRGAFNIPYGAVETAPPAAKDGTVALWDGSKWTIVEDHRDTQFYLVHSGVEYALGSAVKIGDESVTYHGGGPVPSWLTATPPQTSSPQQVDE